MLRNKSFGPCGGHFRKPQTQGFDILRRQLNCRHRRIWNTMATQMLNANADLSTIQDLLGHSSVKTTQRYCRISNLKVQRDYFKAMEVIMQRTVCSQHSS
jgi:integrase